MFTNVSEVLAASIIKAIAASTSETLVNFYQTTQRYNPEDSHLSANEIRCTDFLIFFTPF
jgi:hypothetical protein